MADLDAIAAFWLRFDNTFAGPTMPREVREAVARMNDVGNGANVRLPYRWRVMCQQVEDKKPYADAWAQFISYAEAHHQEDVAFLAPLQLEVMDRHLATPTDLRTAFVLLGSGTLKRPGGAQHVMNNADVFNAKARYTIWFAFARAASRLAARGQEWVRLATFIGLACSIHVRLKPNDKGTNTALLDDATVAGLVRTWQADAATIDEELLDQEFWRLVRK